MSEQIVLETTDLGRRFGRSWVVERLNLRLTQGMAYGLLGPNGAGKSTTIRMLLGMLIPTAGEARVYGFDPQRDPIPIRERVGYVPDMPSLYDWMSVEQMVAFVAGVRRKRWDDALASRLMKDFDLNPKAKIRTLSKGQRTRVSLLLALGFRPDMLILDEPTGGLDPVMRRELIQSVLAESMENGATILISSHLVNEISGLVDHIGILYNGMLTHDGPVEDFLGSIRRIRLFYPEAAQPIEAPGILSQKLNGRETVLTVSNYQEESLLPKLKATGAQDVAIEPLSLEDAYVEIARDGGRTP